MQSFFMRTVLIYIDEIIMQRMDANIPWEAFTFEK